MRFPLPALLLACLLAGCADVTPEDRIRQAFDDVQELPLNATVEGMPERLYVIQSSAILGSLDNTTWTASLHYQPEPLRHEGAQPNVQADGGGSRIDLPAPAVPTFYARLATNDSLAGLDVLWFATTSDWLAEPVALGTTTPRQTLEAPFPLAADSVFAMLMDGDTPVAVTAVPLRLSATVTWEVRDAVHPVNPNGAAPMDEAQRSARADRYHLPQGLAGDLHVETVYDGMWTPNRGTDVDLEFLNGATSLQCIGTGGAASTLPVDPAQSSEVGDQPIDATGEWIVRIGYVSTACGAFYYHNAGPVPYRATITLATG